MRNFSALVGRRPGRRAAGFTLVELMITVAIVGILAAIAYPAYTSSVIKGKRSDGRTALADLLQQQERYLTQTGSYGYNNQVIDVGATGVPFKLYSGNSAVGTAYNLGVRRCTVTPEPSLQDCAEVFADPTFTDTEAGTLWMRSTGEKGCSVTGSTVCWK